MSPRVTAIVVVHSGFGRDGTDHVRSVLQALLAQTRRPERVVVVAAGSGDDVVDEIRGFGPDHIVTVPDPLPFGAAVAAGIRALPEELAPNDLLWFLAQDAVPAPDALRRLVGALEIAPSVGIAAPKVLDAGRVSMIVTFGESMTRSGRRVDLVAGEMDQGQHDTMSDVLGAASMGMLARASAYLDAGGFDPALVGYDDGLDLSVRVRLAGSRVQVVPGATVAWSADGVTGPRRGRRSSTARRNARLERFSQLHRRLVYAAPVARWLHWLLLLPAAFGRIVLALIGKRPERIGAELQAAVLAIFDRRVGVGRRRLSAAKRVPWSALAPLRVSPSEVRKRRRLQRDDGQSSRPQERTPMRFFDGGGAWLLLGAATLGAILVVPLLAGGRLAGSSLMPLSATVPELWTNAGWGWRDLGAGFSGPADPFAALLAVLGSITFWDPSAAAVGVVLFAAPLAAVGAWVAMTRLTERSGFRLTGAAVWLVAPPFVAALADGRLPAILVHILLPWLFFAATAAARSWTAAGVASILVAAVAASSPSLIPALLVAWLVLLLTAGRGAGRIVWTLIPTAALFAPLVWGQGVLRGNWPGLLADPGLPATTPSASGWQLLLGIPTSDGLGWPAIVADAGGPAWLQSALVPALLLPVAALALLSLFQRGVVVTGPLLLVGLAGLATAVGASAVSVTIAGDQAVPIWSGSALSLVWFALAASAVVALDRLPRGGAVPALVAVVAAFVVATPVLTSIPFGDARIQASDGRQLPAYVSASTDADPDVRTLVIRPRGGEAMSAVLVRGTGETLDRQSTVVATSTAPSEDDLAVAEFAGTLATTGGDDAAAEFERLGVAFVVVSDAAVQAGADAGAVDRQIAAIASTLDANAALTPVGVTDRGTLWQVAAPVEPTAVPDTGIVMRGTVFIGLAVVFGAALLLSVPTAASRRAAESYRRTIGHPRTRSSVKRARRLRKRDRGVATDGIVDRPVEDAADAEAAPPAPATGEASPAPAEPDEQQTQGARTQGEPAATSGEDAAVRAERAGATEPAADEEAPIGRAPAPGDAAASDTDAAGGDTSDRTDGR